MFTPERQIGIAKSTTCNSHITIHSDTKANININLHPCSNEHSCALSDVIPAADRHISRSFG